jgi:LPXTG-motif cell wall-anchored protein
MHEAGYRITKVIPQTGGINLSYVWSGMMFGLMIGAAFFVIYAWGVIAYGH